MNALPPRVSFPTDRLIGRDCPACGADTLRSFYAVRGIPVQGNGLAATADEAEGFATGDVVLAQCDTCAFITNTAFDETRLMTGATYDGGKPSPSASDQFARTLAADWIERFNLRGKTLIDIGCGQGEFLEMVCAMAGARGIGFDPRVRRESGRGEVMFVAAPFEDFAGRVQGDFAFCRHTLEHIADPLRFLRLLRPVAELMPIVFEVPDTLRVLQQGAFWDVGYEHNSYFTTASLVRAFQRAELDVVRTQTACDGHSLILEAAAEPMGGQKRDMPALTELRSASTFIRLATARMNQWTAFAGEARRRSQTCVVWGGDSRAVAFLTTLGIADTFACVVDTDPAKHGSYLPGTRLKIEPPSALTTLRPDAVVVMNPMSCDAVKRDLAEMSLTPNVLCL